MKKFLVISAFLTTPLIARIYQEAVSDYQVDHKQVYVLEIAKSLPNKGVLKKKANGYVYLDISNDYIFKIFPHLILDGHLRPTQSFGSEEGAHITVITDQENCPVEEEIGQEFTFEVRELRFVETWSTSGSYGQYKHHTGDRWMIAVESPELEALRMRYGLPPLIENHDFHISIGFEVPFNRINNFGERPSS
jgi:hypothetical protein